MRITRAGSIDETNERHEPGERRRGSALGGTVRVLVPTRYSTDSRFAALLVGHVVRGRESEITITCAKRRPPPTRHPKRIGHGGPNVARGGTDERAEQPNTRSRELPEDWLDDVISMLSGPETDLTVVRTVEPLDRDAVMAEAAEGYDLLVLGASEYARDPDGRSFEGVDRLTRAAPCPVLIVVSNEKSDEPPLENERIRRILLPTVEGEYSRPAAEVAFAIAGGPATVVTIAHWIRPPPPDGRLIRDRHDCEGRALGERLVDRVARMGLKMEAMVLTDVSVSDRPERDIVGRAREDETDLIVLGCELRFWSRRPVLARWTKDVIRHAPCPVAVVGTRDEPETVPTGRSGTGRRDPTWSRVSAVSSEDR